MKPPHPRHPKRPPPARTDWSEVAQWYDELVGDAGSEYQRHVVLPGVLRMLDPRPREQVLDVACGQGVFCRMLHAKGARPTGIDAARPLIQFARQRSGDIPYLVGDARNLTQLKLAPASFDAAVCILAIQNINPLPPVFTSIAQLLRPAGRLVIAMMHPCFRSTKASDWGWDADAGVQYRRIDRYLLPRKEPIVTHPGKDPHGHTWTFHRPLQQYIKALAAAGLMIDNLEEWTSHKVSDSGPRAKAENIARREIPMFLALRALKSP